MSCAWNKSRHSVPVAARCQAARTSPTSPPPPSATPTTTGGGRRPAASWAPELVTWAHLLPARLMLGRRSHNSAGNSPPAPAKPPPARPTPPSEPPSTGGAVPGRFMAR